MSEVILAAIITGVFAVIAQMVIAKQSSKELYAKLDKESELSDARLDAKLDIVQFTRIIICCAIYYNTQHYLAGYEKSWAMLKAGVESIPVKLWEWGIRNSSGNLRTCPGKTLRLALMPKESGSVTEKGSSSKSFIPPARRPGKGNGLRLPGRTADTPWIFPMIPEIWIRCMSGKKMGMMPWNAA